jgi:hypothetical protein
VSDDVTTFAANVVPVSALAEALPTDGTAHVLSSRRNFVPSGVPVPMLMFALPSNETPLIVRAVNSFVAVAALPLVFWLSVGKVQLVRIPDAGVPSAIPTPKLVSDDAVTPAASVGPVSPVAGTLVAVVAFPESAPVKVVAVMLPPPKVK